MNIAKFSVRNPVFVNLMMFGIIVYGVFALFTTPTELNPEIEFNWVFVNVIYTGASPSEIEDVIIDPIESEIQDIEDIDEIQSTAGEGIGVVLIKFKELSNSDFRERYVDLKGELDKVDLPDDTEEPIVDSFSSGDFIPVITVNMAFSLPEESAYRIADNLEDDLKNLTGVSKVQVSGLAEREIWVEVNPVIMNSYHISLNEVMMALMSRNINVPGGTISIGKTEYFIRALGEYESIEEIENTVIRLLPNDSFVKIKDVAKVSNRREEASILSRVNGQKSITFSVSKSGDANSIEVINRVKDLVTTYEEDHPSGLTISYSNDNSIWIMRVINVLRNNALFGMLLIVVVLYFFLGFRNSLLTAMGIPISFFIAFGFMQLAGYTFNGSTLFALVMVLGIIVDDAIIVVENCHRYRLRGFNSHESAIRGTREVAAPIIASILTNIAAFLPLMLLPGIMGKFMRIIPVVFSLALLASLFEAFFLLPSHYADWTARSKIYKRGERQFFKKLRTWYTGKLIKSLRYRYLIVLMLVGSLAGSFAIIPFIDVEMFGDEDFDVFWVLIKMPEGTSLEETDRIVQKYEKEAAKLPGDQVTDIISNIGLLQANEEWLTRKNVAQIFVQLVPQEERIRPVEDIMAELREKTSTISGPISVEFQMVSGGPPVGKDISVKVQGKYYEEIKAAARILEDSIKAFEGTVDIMNNSPPGKQEIQVEIDEEKASLYGFKVQDIAFKIRYAFDGVKATEFRDGDEEIDVIVKYDKQSRIDLGDILNVRLTNNSGQTVALRDMVEFVIRPGDTQILRYDQKRTILVTGSIDKSKTSMNEVNDRLSKIFPELEEKFPGVTLKFGGAFEEFTNIFVNIGSLFMIGLILIFLILGTQFKSYSQPLVILMAVPFSFIGALIGLLISNNPLSVVAMYGFVALAGIVVNDAIVMLSFLNNRRQGENLSVYTLWRSIVNSGRLRLRPIILTSFTTISGLAPMAFGVGGKSEMWSPLANVILFGMLVATVLTLFAIPTFVAILDDMKGMRSKAKMFEHSSIENMPHIN